jgi:transporter family-2 protein
MEKLYLVLLTVIGGICAATQAPVNAALSKHTGAFESSFFSFTVGALSLFFIALTIGKGSILKFADAPPYLWIGGVLGVAFVTITIFAVPKLGSALTVSAAITGQMIAAVIIDQIGFLGVPKSPIDIYRVIGIIFLAIGVRLLMK